MKFSERMGVKSPRLPLNIGDFPSRLRTRLWNAFAEEIQTWSDVKVVPSPYPELVWDEFLALPIESMPRGRASLQQELRLVFEQSHWAEAYDLLEFVLQRTKSERLANRINVALEQELAALRFVGEVFVQVTDHAEIDEIEEALSTAPSEAREHIAQALKCLASRPDPDTRNVGKEVMCAIESVAKQVTGKPSATFSDLPQTLIAKGAHSQFVTAWKNMYSYTSGAGGIRHGLKEGDAPPSVAEAKLFVVTGSAFVNYLVATFL
jgi:hypothetical protein